MINYIIYIVAVGSAIIIGLILKQPLLPEEPKRQSWTLSAIFPTAVLALGFMAMVYKLGYLTSSNRDYLIALIVGVLTVIFSKFILERILPQPQTQEESKDSEEHSPSSKPPESSLRKSSEPSSTSADKNAQEESHE